MNVDEPVKTKKRKTPATQTQVDRTDAEASAYNEDAKDRFKSMQAESDMQYEDDFEDEFEEEDVDNTMDTGAKAEEDAEDEELPPELESIEPDVRRPIIACITP